MWSLSIITQTILVGIGATLIMDLYAVVIKKIFNIPSLDYALVGRWFLYLKDGRFVHKPSIIKSEIKNNEKLIGWIIHYLTGIIFAYCFILIVGNEWLYKTTLIAPVAFGLMTVIFPYFILQPCFGFGIAASKTPQPSSARIRSALAHLSFGAGLYLTAYFLSLLT